MTRKWIAARIDQLDPATDYDEIWKLSAAYRPTDFIMNLVYAVTFPHFFVRELDALPLIDNGDGKILKTHSDAPMTHPGRCRFGGITVHTTTRPAKTLSR